MEKKELTLIELLDKAIIIATRAHAGQKDKGGHPYILHPLTVMGMVESLEEKIVAVLHDVVEDTNWSVEELHIRQGFPLIICNAIDAISKRKNESTTEYLKRVLENDIALNVKIEDLRHNTVLDRILFADSKDYRRTQVYHERMNRLIEYRDSKNVIQTDTRMEDFISKINHQLEKSEDSYQYELITIYKNPTGLNVYPLTYVIRNRNTWKTTIFGVPKEILGLFIPSGDITEKSVEFALNEIKTQINAFEFKKNMNSDNYDIRYIKEFINKELETAGYPYKHFEMYQVNADPSMEHIFGSGPANLRLRDIRNVNDDNNIPSEELNVTGEFIEYVTTLDIDSTMNDENLQVLLANIKNSINVYTKLKEGK